jgi:hypothetical protein
MLHVLSLEGKIFDAVQQKAAHNPATFHELLPSQQYSAYATLALGSALVVNLFCCTAFTLLFRMLGISAGRDATRPADFEANPVPGSRSAALEAQIGRTAHAGDATTKTQESVINRSR